METSEIINVIKNIRNQYKSYKDGGLSFLEHLAKKVLNTVDEDKTVVIQFFLNEIRSNENNFGQIALLTIVEMKAIELCPRIEAIYTEMVATHKDEAWKHSIIEALMIMRYTEAKVLYHEYVNSFLSKKPDYAFFLLVQYCNVDPDAALPLISDFYVKYLFRDSDMKGFLECRIGFLVSYFSKNPINHLPELIIQTLAKNQEVGLHLKTLILDYLNSDLGKEYPKAFVNENIDLIRKI